MLKAGGCKSLAGEKSCSDGVKLLDRYSSWKVTDMG